MGGRVRLGVPAKVGTRHCDRHVLLPSPRPQRDRPSCLYPASYLSQIGRAQNGGSTLSRRAGRTRFGDFRGADELYQKIWDRLDAGYEEMRRLEEEGERTVFSGSTAIEQEAYKHDAVITGVSEEALKKVGNVLTDTPSNFHLHPTLKKRFVPRRAQAMAEGEGIDWALAESLAWGTLLLEGYPVRLSGQDCRRGTFSQRHAVFYDHNTRDRYTPLKNLGEGQAKFCVYNSLLSEAAVLGFDYGYSLGVDNMLIMWEAQFGDFETGPR